MVMMKSSCSLSKTREWESEGECVCVQSLTLPVHNLEIWYNLVSCLVLLCLLIHWISHVVEKHSPGSRTESPFIVLPLKKQNLMDPVFIPTATRIQSQEVG